MVLDFTTIGEEKKKLLLMKGVVSEPTGGYTCLVTKTAFFMKNRVEENGLKMHSYKNEHLILDRDGEVVAWVLVVGNVAFTSLVARHLCSDIASYVVVAVNENSNYFYITTSTKGAMISKLTSLHPSEWCQRVATTVNTTLEGAVVNLENDKIEYGAGRFFSQTATTTLRGVLANCKTTTIKFSRARSPKAYFPFLKEVGDTGEEMDCFTALVNATNQSRSRCEPDAQWYYTSTQREFNAVLLMQGYTPHYRSCMYLPLASLGEDWSAAAIGSKESFYKNVVEALTTKEEEEAEDDDSEFKASFCEGFDEGVRFYFQLDSEGLIKKRFYTFEGPEGVVSSNHYNVAQLPCSIDGKLVKPTTYKLGKLVSVYSNRAKSATRLDMVSKLDVGKFKQLMNQMNEYDHTN